MLTVEIKHSDTISSFSHYAMLNQSLARHSCVMPFMPAKVREPLYIIQTYSTEWRTVTIPHFSTLSNREGEAYPRLAMWRVLKECSVHPAPSLWAFEHRATGGQSQPLFGSVIALWLCTVLNGSVKTMWKSPRACMNSASFGGTRPSLEQWGIFPFLVGPKQKENAQTNAPKASSSD